METKICTKCKEKFPRTKEYFIEKITKPNIKNGLINISYSFKSMCKNCLKQHVKEKRNKITAKKLNISYEDYVNNIKLYQYKQSGEKTIKYHGFDRSNLTRSQRNHITERLRKGDSLEMALFGYKKRAKENSRKALRKYNYGKSLDENITMKEVSAYRKTHLIKAYVANCYKIPAKQLNDELYDALKQNLLLKRKIKNNEQSQICN
jgi:hypothetical protein